MHCGRFKRHLTKRDDNFSQWKKFCSISRPKRIEKFFPELEGLEIFNSSLKSITRNDLKPMWNLKLVHMSSNELKELDGDLFEETQKVHWVDFSDNKIKFVGENLLNNLKQLKVANFENNTCIFMTAAFPVEIAQLKRELREKCSISDKKL